MAICRVVFFVLVSALLVGCPPPALEISEQYTSWREFKDEVAKYLNDELALENNMRVIPASIVYPIGTVLRRGSLSSLSSRCSFVGEPPPPVPGPLVPTVSLGRITGASLDPGTFLGKGIKELQALNISYDRGATLYASATELTVQQIAEDQVLHVIMDDNCFADLDARELSVVRGHIATRFHVRSRRAIAAGISVELYETEFAKFRHFDGSEYEIEEKNPSTQFLILADGRRENILAFVAASDDGPIAGREDTNRDRRRVCKEEVPLLLFGGSQGIPESAKTQYSAHGFSSCDETMEYIESNCFGDSHEAREECLEKFPFYRNRPPEGRPQRNRLPHA